MRAARPDSEHIERLLAETESKVRQGEVPCALFADGELYRRELESVFGACWVFVAYESEVAAPGDFVLRTIGEDEVVVVRDEDMGVNVLRNACRHRGAAVCHDERGNAKHFSCPYHGWTYDKRGAWVGAPFKGRAYRTLDGGRWGLHRAPHVDSYRGLIFACLDPDAVPLAEYLGDMRWYLDVCFGLSSSGMSVSGRPHRWMIDCNWKTAAENFLCDGYHVGSLHRSVEEIGVLPKERKGAGGQFHVYFESGHGALLSCRPLPEPWGVAGYPPMVAETFDLRGLTDEQTEFLSRYCVTTFNIFPNLSFIRVPGRCDRESAPVVHTALRQWQPRGCGRVEAWNWCLTWPQAPRWFNEQAYRASITSFGPGGIFEQDDGVVWRGATGAGAAVFGGRATFNYQMGMSGMSEYMLREGWMGPGRVSDTVFGEDPQRAFYARWLCELRAGGVQPRGGE